MKKVKAVVFDLDGTLYLSGRPYPGAVETVNCVAKQVPVYYLSNNTSKSPVFYENRLKVMGLPLAKDSIISALYLSLDAIHERKIKNVFFFANPEVYEWFAAQDPSKKPSSCLLLTTTALTIANFANSVSVCSAESRSGSRIRILSAPMNVAPCPISEASWRS